MIKAKGSRIASPSVLLWAIGLGLVIGVASSGACSGDGGGDTATGATANTGASSSTASNTGGGGSGTSVGGGGSGSSVGGGGNASTSSGGGAPPLVCPSPCANQVYECGDCQDNDGDGLIDSQDPDCLGACDNTENSYYPNLPGAPGGPCKSDCFWDNGNGSGNDDCYWDHRCDQLEVAPDYPPEGINCAYDPTVSAGGGLTCQQAYTQQSQVCLDYCGPLAPNGCDCFGCCELPAGSGKFVWLGSEVNGAGSCTIDVVNDTSLCKPCTFVPGCGNPCETCEICIGKPTLPPECYGDGGTDGGLPQQCPPGQTACDLFTPCPSGYYCITGCCVELPQ